MPIKSMKSMNAKAAKGLVVDTEVGLLQEIPGIVFGPQKTPRITLLPGPIPDPSHDPRLGTPSPYWESSGKSAKSWASNPLQLASSHHFMW